MRSNISRVAVAGATAAVLCLTGLGAATPAHAAPPAKPAAPAPSPAESFIIRSNNLEIHVSRLFPQVLRYRDLKTGAILGGQPKVLDSVVINGTPQRVTVGVEPLMGGVNYVLTVPGMPGVSIIVRATVKGNVLTWQVQKVRDGAKDVVNTLEIPGLDLVSVSSDQPGATSALTKVDTNSTRNADQIAPLTEQTAVQANAVGSTYGILNTAQLAASVETNGTYDKPKGATTKDGGRLWSQVQANTDGSKRVGLTPGQWTVRGEGAAKQSELPWAKVVITTDRNQDQAVDWQDGAIAFRDIAHVAKDADKVPDRVIQHIPFNFSSLATHPFLRTLDDVKRLSLATDGLGQFTLLKGYASEGHDSAHPDYAGNYNERAGGLKDMNTLLKEGKKWGSDFGVHVNATEAYPEAKAFDEKLVDKTALGWNWLNQSYYINQRDDLNSGNLLKRTAQLRKDTKGNLDTLYWDVYYGFGWLPDEMDAKLRGQGWSVASEWAYSHERNSLWSHWATDRNYGGATNKGINSQIIRFIRNGEKDVWNPHPLLAGSTIVEAEGWTGHNDWNALKNNVWTNQLPTKFLQHNQITKWTDHEVQFTNGVRSTDANGHRQFLIDGQLALDGGSYLLPWGGKTPQQATKAYHFNPDGGTTTWTLTGALARAKSFTVYELSDKGRTAVGTVGNDSGKITLEAKANTAYVIYPGKTRVQTDPAWGQGTPVADPGFNGADLGPWNPTGKTGLETTENGLHVASLGEGKSGISQDLKLAGGKRYAASAWVEVKPGQSRPVTLTVNGKGVDASTSIERSTMPNHVSSDELRGTNFQRVKVLFTAPRNGKVRLAVTAADGTAPVRIDDVRVVPTEEKSVSGNVLVDQSFESLDQGWGPFVTGQAGGDARTHLATKHAPYTQAGWNGKLVDDVLDGQWSLKSHEEGRGLVYRTWQGSVDFKPGHKYRVEFDHQNATAGAYSFVTGVDQAGEQTKQVELKATAFGQQRTTARFSQEFTTGGCGDPWIGIRRNAVGGAQADFIMDNLKITDLGAVETPGACATAELSGPRAVVPGEENVFTTTFTNHEGVAISDVKMGLDLPDGWTATGTQDGAASGEPGATVKTIWKVMVPADAKGSYTLSSSVSYRVGESTRTVDSTLTTQTLPEGLIPQSRLKISGVSSAEPGSGDGSAQAAVDGNPSTMWHSAWSRVSTPATYPHWITFDLGSKHELAAFDYQVRKGNGAIKDYEIYVSADGKDWGTPVAKGSFAGTAEVQHITLPPNTTGQHVKLVGLNAINGAAFGGANEINLWGKRA
ncbi:MULTISPECIES: endo-alpha-N-acetylgalactosaminidase family protein [unclassified Luteococcus]|uniref:endo-alpha-N-acetylgalactosaminidase family protein n=1 Tax=unclassified Luteococcus TaxID=2639923 RepID=UPI00313ED856